jgi:2-methylcitrate dehydratase PrpD
MALQGEWWQTVNLGQVAAAVVVVSVAGSDRKEAERALRRLGDLGIPTYLVVQPSRRNRHNGAAPTQTPEPTASETSAELSAIRVDDHAG